MKQGRRPIFLRQMLDDEFRFTLTLIKLNENSKHTLFKMDISTSVLCFFQPNNYMAKLDIKDAY